MTDADILRLWRSGYDTLEIAWWHGEPEYKVANRLARLRDGSVVKLVTFGQRGT